jgi:hypothetical protein
MLGSLALQDKPRKMDDMSLPFFRGHRCGVKHNQKLHVAHELTVQEQNFQTIIHS